MPELPEIQALAERIHTRLVGAAVVRLEPLSFSGLKTVIPAPDSLVGRPLEAVGRRGKFLLMEFGGPHLLVHLSQGGRIVFEEGTARAQRNGPGHRHGGRPKGAVARFAFDRPPGLLLKEFGTERKAGWWVLEPGDDGPLGKLGPEPFSEQFESVVSAGSDNGRLHAFLRDQRRVAGIGRGYADDILHRAKLSPFRSLASLSDEERGRLLDSVRTVLTEALEVERRRDGGLPPKLGDHFAVHGKHGQACPACGEDLRRVSYESHEVTYCPRCQTGGRVLSDRRLSRLVR